MLSDINSGEDIHYNSGRSVLKWKRPSDMTTTQRKIVKNVNFGLLYGGKAAGLSRQTGIDKSTVQALITSFYKTYPDIPKWQRAIYEQVVDNMEVHKIVDGEQTYKSIYVEPISKRKFTFVEQKSPDWLRRKTGRGYSFSPQQISNYPIQGFAGGDLTLTTLTNLWRHMKGDHIYPGIKFLMTIHDSILIEIQKGMFVNAAMKGACIDTEETFNLPVSLQFDEERGNKWQ
jgi:DNA polymerase I-like protein with 3'-5' exonuclease and polymerase domains